MGVYIEVLVSDDLFDASVKVLGDGCTVIRMPDNRDVMLSFRSQQQAHHWLASALSQVDG